MTDPLGQSQVIPYLAGLSKLGYNITLLSAEKPERLAGGKDLISRLLKEANITWCPTTYTAKPKVLSTLYDVWQLNQMADKLHKEKNFALVHCRSYIAALVGLRMKRKYEIKYLFDMRGLWADERVDGGLWKLDSPIFRRIYNFFKKKEKQFFEQADYTVSLTEACKREVQSWPLAIKQPIPIQVIPCCADLDLFNYQNIDSDRVLKLKAQLGFSANDEIITYLGSVGTWYMLPEMLKLFKKIKALHSNLKFLFITADEPSIITTEAQKQSIALTDIVVTKAQRKEVPYYIALGEASMFFVKQSYSKIASSPTKMGEIMGMGKPLICNAGVGDVEEICNNTHTGICLKDFSDDELSRAANEYATLLATPPDSIRQGALRYYSLTDGVAKYAKVYQQLLGS